jgi:hypothetical protein
MKQILIPALLLGCFLITGCYRIHGDVYFLNEIALSSQFNGTYDGIDDPSVYIVRKISNGFIIDFIEHNKPEKKESIFGQIFKVGEIHYLQLIDANGGKELFKMLMFTDGGVKLLCLSDIKLKALNIDSGKMIEAKVIRDLINSNADIYDEKPLTLVKSPK